MRRTAPSASAPFDHPDHPGPGAGVLEEHSPLDWRRFGKGPWHRDVNPSYIDGGDRSLERIYQDLNKGLDTRAVAYFEDTHITEQLLFTHMSCAHTP